MAQRDIATLKGYFRTNAYPTEAQFGDLIDSLIHKSTGIGFNDVAGLADYINDRNNTLLSDIDKYFVDVAERLQLERRISVSLERTEADLYIHEPMIIYKVGVRNVETLTLIIDGEEIEVDLGNDPDSERDPDEELEIEIDADSLITLRVERQNISYKSHVFFYRRAQV